MELEDPLITNLHQALVLDGDFEEAEKVIVKADERKIFQTIAAEAKYTPSWQRLFASNDGNYGYNCVQSKHTLTAIDGDAPCARGGHQLCIDTDREKIYLFGGWDGKRELSDFWCYHIKEARWKLLSSDTAR